MTEPRSFGWQASQMPDDRYQVSEGAPSDI
jgi:hypothetical protein